MIVDNIFVFEDDKQRQIIKRLEDKYFRSSLVFIVPDGVKKIDCNAFTFCKAFAFELPDSLEEIGREAFYGCKNLRMVFIPKGVKIIERGAFAFCDNLEIYCEGEPAEGWVDEEPEYRTESVTTEEDYAFDFHRGGVSYTEVEVKIDNRWNPNPRPVYKNCSREEFTEKLKAFLE